MGFLHIFFYLLCTAEDLFYRDGQLSLAAALMLPQSPLGMRQGCASQRARLGLALGTAPKGMSCQDVEVLKPGSGVKL